MRTCRPGVSTATTGTDVATFLSGFVQAISDLDMHLRSGFGTSEHAAAEWAFAFHVGGGSLAQGTIAASLSRGMVATAVA
jgi:hypothetical protein